MNVGDKQYIFRATGGLGSRYEIVLVEVKLIEDHIVVAYADTDGIAALIRDALNEKHGY